MSAGAKQIFGTALELVGEFIPIPGLNFAVMTLGALISADGARQKAHQAADRANAEQRRANVQGNVRGSLQEHTIVFGQARVGGVICTLGTANGPDMPNQDLYIGVAHSICHPGGCGGMVDLWIDDTRVTAAQLSGDPSAGEVDVTVAPFTGMVHLRHYKGTGTQTADSTLVAQGIDSSTDYRRGVAWTWFRLRRPTSDESFRQAFKYGIPQVSVELKGINCYDPRLDSTNGGSGSQRYTDPTSWTWTRNPALCAATYMMMAETDGGWGRDPTTIDWPSVASAANTCEETISVPGGTRPRFTCDGVLLTSDKREANLQKILDTMAGRRIRVGAKYKFYAGVYRTPVTAIDDTWLAGGVKVTTRAPLESQYNAIRVNFTDSSQDYKSIEAPPVLNSTYETQDGGYRVWRDLNLPLVANTYNAQYCGEILSNQSRTQMIVELVCNLKALDLETWETVTLSLPNLPQLAGLVFRVAGWVIDKNGIAVTLQQELSSTYTVGTLTVPSNNAASVGSETPPAPTGLTAVGVADGVALTWTNPPGYLYQRMQIERATSSGGTYSVIGYVNNQTTAYTDSFTGGGTFYYRIAARTRTGTLGAYSSIVSGTAKQASDAGSTTVTNGNFELGDTGWTKDAGWAIVLDAGNSYDGSWEGQFTGGATGKLTNSRRVPVAAGDLVLAYGFLKATSGATGNGYIRISWLNSSGAEIGSILGNAITGATAYTQSRVSASAPTGVAFAVIQFQCDAPGGGKTWYADGTYLTVTSKSLDEIPNGTTYIRTPSIISDSLLYNGKFSV